MALAGLSAYVLVAILVWGILNIAAIVLVTLIGCGIIWLRSNDANLA